MKVSNFHEWKLETLISVLLAPVLSLAFRHKMAPVKRAYRFFAISVMPCILELNPRMLEGKQSDEDAQTGTRTRKRERASGQTRPEQTLQHPGVYYCNYTTITNKIQAMVFIIWCNLL